MYREKRIETAYQKGKELSLKNENYLRWISAFFDREYADDIGAGDLTSKAVLTKNKTKIAFIKSKVSGILGGLEEVSWFFHKYGLEVKTCFKDGEEVEDKEIVLEIEGKQKDILATERIALNVLQRMSGIATETKKLVDLLEGYNTRIAATRKTLLRYLDKKAVFLGGGLTHRFGLWDSILVKDNHLENLKSEGIDNYIEVALTNSSSLVRNVSFIEIEVTSHEEAIRAAKIIKKFHLCTPFVIMLDNMKPLKISHIIETLRNKNLYEFVLLEASGEITRKNIQKYARTGVDVVSLGYLTHSAKVLNMSLEMEI